MITEILKNLTFLKAWKTWSENFWKVVKMWKFLLEFWGLQYKEIEEDHKVFTSQPFYQSKDHAAAQLVTKVRTIFWWCVLVTVTIT